ncbi:MarR family winged helix-turn-helix transcriptional regulator [Qingshengfaniella alkalisoli]|uniref:MarR family transcriptional regulator n=1 Tax=Qingshengfaniella alkalisoli TaxID=2599296 RepID=A0A5B8I4X8_9RHOB|nr:MarR family transcriptional regulator [Qingshengfaniella alkalisoli]QDY68259.1 MarR family transcriptional regulator [Qingshengfaniella alkalisoli]
MRDELPADTNADPAARTTSPVSANMPTLGEIGLQRYAPYLMNRIMGLYNASVLAELNRHGISIAKLRALAVLSARPGLMINELAVYCVIEQSTMSRTLASMLNEGLIRRQDDTEDNRVRRIYLTDKGREVFEHLWPAMASAHQDLFEGINEAERDAFVTTLNRMLLNVRKHPF